MQLDQAITATHAVRYKTVEKEFDALVFKGAEDRLIIVLPDWRGCLTDYAMRRGYEICEATGATVYVTDPYGIGRKPVTYAGDAELWISKALSDPVHLRANIATQISALVNTSGHKHEQVSVVGYCLGGALAIEAARSGAKLQTVISVHGIPSSNIPLEQYTGSTSFVAIHGADDPIIGMNHIRAFEAEMSAVKADWTTVIIGGARHGFTNEDADPQGSHQRYDGKAAIRTLSIIKGFIKPEGLAGDR